MGVQRRLFGIEAGQLGVEFLGATLKAGASHHAILAIDGVVAEIAEENRRYGGKDQAAEPRRAVLAGNHTQRTHAGPAGASYPLAEESGPSW